MSCFAGMTMTVCLKDFIVNIGHFDPYLSDPEFKTIMAEL